MEEEEVGKTEEKDKKKKKGKTKRTKAEKIAEIKEKRTKNSRTWKNSDLSESIEVFPVDVHYQEPGKKEWKEIDNDVTEQISTPEDKVTFKYQNKANKYKASFGKDASKEIFKMKQGSYHLSYSIREASPSKPVGKDQFITYEKIFPNIDAKYTIRANGVKEDFIINKKTNQKNIVFDLKTNLQVTQKENVIEFTDPKTKTVVWNFEPPFMRDAEDKESHKNYYELKSEKGSHQLTLVLDQDFITDPETKFPILLDPTLTVGGTTSTTSDAYVGEVYNNVNYGSDPELRTGYAPTVNSHRTFIKFGTSLPSLNGGLLTGATFKAYKYYEPASVDTTVNIHKANAAWGETTVKWNNQPTFDGSYASQAFPKGAANGWYSWGVTNLVNYWYDNPANYHGLVMQASNENTTGSYRKFYSGDYSSGTYAPKLEITYSPKPSAPTGSAQGNGVNSKNGYVNLNWTAVSGATGYKVLIYNGASYEEFNVGNVTSYTTKGKKLWPLDNTCSLKKDGTGGELPDDPRSHYQKCGNNYPNNKNFWFRVVAYNGNGDTAQSDAFMPTIPDATAPSKPGKPVVSNKLDSNFTFTWGASTDSNSGLKGYHVYVGTGAGKTDVVNGTFVTTNSFTVPNAVARTNYHMYVKAIDNQGNYINSDASSDVARKQMDASIVSYSIPPQMEASLNYDVAITVKNEGLQTWTSTDGFYLGSKEEIDPLTKDTRMPIPSGESIGPTQTKTFNLKFNGGKNPGNFLTQWQMLKLTVGRFGDEVSSTIKVVDTTSPTGNIVINNGEPITNSPNVNLNLSMSDNANGPYQQKIRNEQNTWSVYETFSPSKSWVLSEGNEVKTVSVTYKDASGNESTVSSDTIILDTSYPTSRLDLPRALDYVNGKTLITGTALDDKDLRDYSVSYGQGESPQTWTVINQKSQTIEDNVLAEWDTERLAAGLYTIKLAVSDQAGNTSVSTRMVWVDPIIPMLGSEDYWAYVDTQSGYGMSKVNVANGNLFFQSSDSSLKGRGLDTTISRSYNSQDGASTTLGQGWRLDLHMSISEEANGNLQLVDEDGTRHTFIKNTDSTFTAPKGVYRQLVKLGNGTYTLKDLDESGIVQSFDSNGKLVSYEDRNGNKNLIRYEGATIKEIEDATGRITNFVYQNERLVEISTFAGTKIKYGYTNDRLTKVEYFDKDINLYRTLTYDYNAYGKLKEYVNPKQNKIIYEYNGHRLVNVQSTLTSRNAATGGKNAPWTLNESYVYNLTNKTTRVSQAGPNKSSISDYETNENGNLIKSVDDPDGLRVAKRNTYENNNLKESINGKGYKTSFTYDGIGNVLTETEPTTKDIEGNTYTPVTTYEYKPGTNLVTKETDPLGRIKSYDYDTKGNRIWAIDSDGFKETYKYDEYGNVIETAYERGPLYGYVPNYSFETGEGSSFPSWRISGTAAYQTADKRSGAKSLILNGTAESDYVPVKSGKLPVRVLGWIKGTGAVTSVQFYDQSKSLISSKSSAASTSASWTLQHVAADIPAGAAFVTYKVGSSSSLLVDDVRMEESGYTLKNTYSTNGLHLVESFDPYGKKMVFEYDTAGNKKKEINELGQASQFTYNADHQITEQMDRLGKLTKFEYDANGNLLKETDALGQAVEYEYDEQNHQVVIRQPKVTKTFYDLQVPRTPEVVTITEIDEYNELGEKVAEKDGNGSVIRYDYDALGRQVKSIDPLRNELRFTYDANDNKLTEEDWAFDAVTSTPHLRGITHNRYDELDRMISSSDPTKDQNTLVEQNKYDAVGNLVKTITGTGAWTEFQYDKNNNAIYSRDSSTPSVETWTLYDGLGNEAVALDKLGATTYIYEANGQLKDVVDAEGKRTVYTYNAAGDKTKLVDATGSVTDWTYDEEGQLKTETKEIKDPNTGETTLQIVSYAYDAIGQVQKKSIKETKGSATTTSKEIEYVYDELSQLVKETGTNTEDGKKTESRFYHDNNGNVTHTWVYDETNPVPIPVDPDGDGFYNSETVSIYDKNNRLLSETISHTNTVTTNTFNDNKNEETMKNALGDTVVTYDNSDRTQKIMTPNFDTFSYEYLVDDSLSKVTAPGIVTDITYNGGSKVKTLKAKNRGNGNVVIDLDYQHSDTEQIIQISDKGSVKKKYTYTASGQLETVESNGKKLKYSYDANSNLLKVENLSTGKVIESYTYATENRILQKKVFNDSTGSLVRTYDYVHNPSGTLAKITLKEGATTTVTDYGYNSDDQLMKVNKTVNGQKQPEVLYEYDTDGNRIAKNINDGSKNTHYHYHRDTNGELFLETIEGPSQQQRLKYYRDADGNVLSFSLDEVVYYYQFNARGDVIAITDAAGNVKATYDYDEWGNVIAMTGDQALANANVYRYVGKYGVMYDVDTNLYLMGWRDYDPSTGRFIVPDEYEGTEEDPTSLNRYLYADADPVNNIDPDGHAPKWLQKGWKASKKYARKGYNAYIGNDIRTLRNPKSKWYHKAGATVSIASNFIPGAGQAKWAVKGLKGAVKYGKKAKKAKKFAASSLKKSKSKRNVNASRKCNCFTLGTKVLTEDGEKPIEDIQVGDKVLAKDEESGDQAYKEVEWLYERDVDTIYQLHIKGKVIETTDEHPFWVVGEGWIKAKDLVKGDLLETSDGTTLSIDDIKIVKKHVTVYNFKVKDYHSYFVSDLGVWTHNKCTLTYQTYTKKNKKTGEVYTGRTSGRGTPLQNVTNRDRNHHMNKEGFGAAVLDKSSKNKNAIRGREQLLIEKNGGAKSKKGKSGNKINGISDNNKKRKTYIKAARKEFY
ncbi:hypothetical protein AZ46_0216830 [Metabacillus indicus LMG 22858]|nr:hypothetical protein AZ46_0216830 [Metabacillus indicus LMG 22858]